MRKCYFTDAVTLECDISRPNFTWTHEDASEMMLDALIKEVSKIFNALFSAMSVRVDNGYS